MTARRVLVTGGSGFIGRACLAPLTRRGFEVHAQCRSGAAGTNAGDVAWHAADLLQTGAAAALVERVRPTHLLHSAWIAVPTVFWSSPDNLRWLTSSIELFDAFGRYGGQRALGIGSCAEYDGSYGVCHEADTPLRPNTCYGLAKHATHAALGAAAALRAYSSAWARIFFPYGPGEPATKLLSAVTRALLRREHVDCTHGRQLRDFIYVDDAAETLVALLDSQVEDAVNIGSGEAASLREAIQCIVELTGGADLVCYGARPTPAGEPPILVAAAMRLRALDGWRAPLPLAEGIARLVQSLRATA